MLLCTHSVFLAANDELCPCSIGSRAQFAFLCFWERSIDDITPGLYVVDDAHSCWKATTRGHIESLIR